MSKSPAPLQTRILAELASAGNWLFLAELAERIAPCGGRSARVSIGRAVASLARRGLVKRGDFRNDRAGKESLSAAVWLPDGPSPQGALAPLIPIPRQAVEDAVLAALRDRTAKGERSVQYEYIANAVRRRLRCEENRIFVATARAVHRLAEQGKIEAIYHRREDRRRIRSVRLREGGDVAW